MAGIYIHIPFCRKKCIYCDFYSIGTKGLEDAYIDAVIKECSLRRNELRNSPLKTIYIGGGTPSLLSPAQIGKIVKASLILNCIAPDAIGKTTNVNAT